MAPFEVLQKYAPFNTLSLTVLKQVAKLVSERKLTSSETIYFQDSTELKGIDIIIEGEYNATYFNSKSDKVLEEKYTKGMIYGGSSILLNKKYSIRTVTTTMSTTVYTLPKEEFKALCRANEDFFNFFTSQFGQKVLNESYAGFVNRNNIREENFLEADKIYNRKIKSLEPRTLLTCEPSLPIKEAALILKNQRPKCLFIKNSNDLSGYVTKEILSDNVLANAISIDMPVSMVMNKNILKINEEAFVYEALLKLLHKDEEYIMVTNGDSYKGYLSKYRLLSEHAQSPLVFVQSVNLAQTNDELKDKWEQVPEIINRLLLRGVNAEIVNQVITAMADNILQKVITDTLNEQEEPPAKFAFFVLGSEGRKEQTLVTDQDNAIIYEDKANEHREEVRKYFLSFAKKVSDTLDYIGFSYCKGGFMAQNPKWTHSLSHWKRNYTQWVTEQDQEMVYHMSTFFDCRFVYGDPKLLADLQDHLENLQAGSNISFLYRLADHALKYDPPITFFKGFKTFKSQEKKVIDIKKAMTPLVDLARMYALKYNIRSTNTGRRLHQLYEQGCLTQTAYKELSQAYYYLMAIRLKTQSQKMMDSFEYADNLVEPTKLTIVEQATLKEIFRVIKDFQVRIKVEFKNELFS